MLPVPQSSGAFPTVFPSDSDALLAAESASQLGDLAAGFSTAGVTARFAVDAGREEVVTLPTHALKLLQEVLTEMGKGNSVAIVPMQAELTTQQAADLLKVSRPFLIEQLHKGAIPHRMVGKHRRIAFSDLMDYKRTTDKKRLVALEELSEIDQRLDLGYR